VGVTSRRAGAAPPPIIDRVTDAGAPAVRAFLEGLEPFWHPVLRAEELADRPVQVELLGRPLALARLGDGLACLDDVCRHLGASLSLGAVTEAGGIRCPYHGWTYDRGGVCVDIPARRDAPIPRDARLRSYHVAERYGLVWVCLAAEPTAGIPDFPEHDDPRYHKTPLQTYAPWAASAPRVIMGALDDTHFPWVHPGLLGDPGHPEPPEHEAHEEGPYVVSSYSILQPANETISGAEQSGELETVTYTNYCTPTTIRLLKDGPAGRYAIFQAVTPVRHDHSLVFLQMARDFDTDPGRDPDYMEFEDRIQEQDRPVVESQRPWLLPPLSARLQLYVRPADLPLVVFQRRLEELGIPQI
jgi:phenylpropionate dioxygenase-like ring-hydroxylating dioxygenase large terminal subunit